QLFLSLGESGRRLPEAAGAASEHQWPRDQWRWNRHRVPYLFQPISTLGPSGADRKTMFSDGCSFESTRNRLRHPNLTSHQEPDRIAKETFEGSKGDSAEISAEVEEKFEKNLRQEG
ncbi:hypothetical protein Prudu_016831, partial [Prunus dulcis]